MSRVHVWVDCTLAPLGSFTRSGLLVTALSAVGASVTKKWLVAPLSKMAHFFRLSISKVIVWSRLWAAWAYLGPVVGVQLGMISGGAGFSSCVYVLTLKLRITLSLFSAAPTRHINFSCILFW